MYTFLGKLMSMDKVNRNTAILIYNIPFPNPNRNIQPILLKKDKETQTKKQSTCTLSKSFFPEKK